MDESIKIHGESWKLADIQDSVEWARTQKWEKQKWAKRTALVSNGKVSDYVGQKYNSEHTKLVENGWEHDHCEICWWALCESEEPENGVGFTTDGHNWLCTECFQAFVEKA